MKRVAVVLVLIGLYVSDSDIAIDEGQDERVYLPAELIENAFKGRTKISKRELEKILYQSYTMNTIEKGEELFDKINKDEELSPIEELHHHYFLVIQFLIEDKGQEEYTRDEIDDLIENDFIKQMVDKFYNFDEDIDLEDMLKETEDEERPVIESNV